MQMGSLKRGIGRDESAPPWRFRCGELALFSAPAEFVFGGNGQFIQVVTVNAEIFVLAHEDSRLRSLLRSTVNTVDGRILQWTCGLLYGGRHVNLLKGADFIHDLCTWCCARKQRLYLLGSSQASNAAAVSVLRNSYQGLQVDGFGPPLEESPFAPSLRLNILGEIARWRPHHLVVCFGPPKQEFWIQENAGELAGLGVRRAYGLGGTIDFLSRHRRRAPHWVQFIGAEWFFRLLCEPRARFRKTVTMFRMPLYALRTKRSAQQLELPLGAAE